MEVRARPPGQPPAPPPSGQRDPVTGSIYFPYKATPFWFGGNSEGVPARLAQGAAEYKPSGDPAYSSAATRKPYIGDGGKIGDDVPPKGPALGYPHVGTAGSGVAVGGTGGQSLWATNCSGSVVSTMKQARPSSALPMSRTSQAAAAAAGADAPGAAAAGRASSSTPRSRPSSAAPRLNAATLTAAGKPSWAGVSGRSGSVGRGAAPSFTGALSQPSGLGSMRLERQILRDDIASVRSLA